MAVHNVHGWLFPGGMLIVCSEKPKIILLPVIMPTRQISSCNARVSRREWRSTQWAAMDLEILISASQPRRTLGLTHLSGHWHDQSPNASHITG